MPTAIDTLAESALGLQPDQRLALARRLLDSVDLEPAPDAEAAAEAEIVGRIARLDGGETETVPAEKVFDRLRQIAPTK